MNADGAIDSTIDNGFSFYDSTVEGWVATAISINADGSFKVLWDDGDNGTQCCVWYMDADGVIDTTIDNGFSFYDSGVMGWVAHGLSKNQ